MGEAAWEPSKAMVTVGPVLASSARGGAAGRSAVPENHSGDNVLPFFLFR